MRGGEYGRYLWELINGYRARAERDIADRRLKDIQPYLASEKKLEILDLANGRLRPQYRLLSSAGHRVYGIDRVNRNDVSWVNVAYQFSRVVFNWTSKIALGSWRDRTLICGNVSCLPFRKNTFDLITSVAAFEHFLDVPSVVKEVQRVLKPEGIAWIGIHPFACLSGGHNVNLTRYPLRRLPRSVEAWDHLRKRRIPFHVPLNEWRNVQYVEEISKHLEVVNSYCALREGEEFLTPEIESELAAYSRDELTCGAYVIVAQKPNVNPS